MIHLFDASFSEEESFALRDEIWDVTIPFLDARAGRPRGLQMAVATDDRLFAVPTMYDGVLHRFDRGGSSWQHTRLRGRRLPYDLFLLHDADAFMNKLRSGALGGGEGFAAELHRMRAMFSNSATHGAFVATVRSQSRGLFVMSDGRIVHFSTRFASDDDNAEVHLLVELFDPEANLIGYGPVTNYPSFKADERAVLEVLAIDDQDRFYLTDQRGGFPVLKVVRLVIEQ